MKSSDGPQSTDLLIASASSDEPSLFDHSVLKGWQVPLLYWLAVGYTVFHLLVLNVFPLETWTFRILHVAGALLIGFLLTTTTRYEAPPRLAIPEVARHPASIVALAAVLWAVAGGIAAFLLSAFFGLMAPPPWVFESGGVLLLAGIVVALIGGWTARRSERGIDPADWALGLAAVAVALYLLFNLSALQFRAGVMPTGPDFWYSLSGVIIILELTRRLAGLPLVIIAVVFIVYSFVGPFFPGFLYHEGYSPSRFFSYIYTDNGILGPTTAVSSTYIILFIAFGAFLQASKVGDYFVNFAFACAGRARGGPAKVAIFASGLMGMINGTSAGNVVATGSLTIPLMKRVGYRPQSAGAIEAAASTGGQIMPPVMGAGAFIMAEITGIPYVEICLAALIPAVLYFISIYFMVDFEAARTGMRGMRQEELPVLGELVKRVYLFIPIVTLIAALFMGYSVIRAGTLSLASATVVSWLTPHRLGPAGIIRAFELSTIMALQLIAVCACAGIIVGVIGLTGVGLRFSSILLEVADTSQLLALVFAMGISILLGMGMPTTAAYAVAASVVAPGLIQLGITPLVAHFFVFYFAVISAITPPVALAAYAGAGIAGADPMRTSVTAFKLGLAAVIVPFMFFYSPGLLMEADWPVVARNFVTATFGVFLLSGAVQGWFFGRITGLLRLLLLVAAVTMIEGGIYTDLAGIALAGFLLAWQRMVGARQTEPKPATAAE